jgi:ribonucleoside-triphosphate reductase
LALKDKGKCGNKISDTNISDVSFYTNWVHVSINYPDELLWLLDHPGDLQTKFLGGTVVHCFLGELVYDMNIAKKLMEKNNTQLQIALFSLTPIFSICSKYG